MRKVGFAVALAAAALFAQGVRADAGDEAKKAGAAVSDQASKTGEDLKEAGQRAAGSPATSVDAKVFDGKHNFDVDGKIKKVSKSSITIARTDGLPPATLGVAKGAKVQLDGNDVSMSALKPGEDVKASFNLDGSQPAAVEIKAKRADK